jgi:hypothetical protein
MAKRVRVSVTFLHRWFRHAWYLTWLAARIHAGRGPIDCALCVANLGTINWAPTEHVCNNMTPTRGYLGRYVADATR